LVFKKNAIFFAENWEKSQKIVIITSTPGCCFPTSADDLFMLTFVGLNQGDQIGRIFAERVAVYFGQLLENGRRTLIGLLYHTIKLLHLC
jgi:hypothetical protein